MAVTTSTAPAAVALYVTVFRANLRRRLRAGASLADALNAVYDAVDWYADTLPADLAYSTSEEPPASERLRNAVWTVHVRTPDFDPDDLESIHREGKISDGMYAAMRAALTPFLVSSLAEVRNAGRA